MCAHTYKRRLVFSLLFFSFPLSLSPPSLQARLSKRRPEFEQKQKELAALERKKKDLVAKISKIKRKIFADFSK